MEASNGINDDNTSLNSTATAANNSNRVMNQDHIEVFNNLKRLKMAGFLLLILLAKFVADNLSCIVFYLTAVAFFERVQRGLKEYTSQRLLATRTMLIKVIAGNFAILIYVLCFVYLYLNDKAVFARLKLQRAEVMENILCVLWLAAITDLTVQVTTCIIKCIVCLLFNVNGCLFGTSKIYTTMMAREGANSLAITDTYDVESGQLPPIPNQRSVDDPIRRRESSNLMSMRRLAAQSVLQQSISESVDRTHTVDTTDASKSTHESLDDTVSLIRRKQAMAVLDALFFLYRSILPVPLWVSYLSSGVNGNAFVSAYLCGKFVDCIWKGKGLLDFVGSIFSGNLEYGRRVSGRSLPGACDCPICFDTLRYPIALGCDHVFCEVCISEWLDKELTCPVCRAEVVRSSQWTTLKEEASRMIPVVI